MEDLSKEWVSGAYLSMIKSSVNLKLYTKCICSVIAQIILYNMNKQTRDLSKYFNEIAPKTKESYKYIFLKFSMMYRHHILLTILSCLFKCTELQSWRFYEEFLVHLLSCCPNKKIFNTYGHSRSPTVMFSILQSLLHPSNIYLNFYTCISFYK